VAWRLQKVPGSLTQGDRHAYYAVVFFIIALVPPCSASAASPRARGDRQDPVLIFLVLFAVSLVMGLSDCRRPAEILTGSLQHLPQARKGLDMETTRRTIIRKRRPFRRGRQPCACGGARAAGAHDAVDRRRAPPRRPAKLVEKKSEVLKRAAQERYLETCPRTRARQPACGPSASPLAAGIALSFLVSRR
jgi:hypothetical protein